MDFERDFEIGLIEAGDIEEERKEGLRNTPVWLDIPLPVNREFRRGSRLPVRPCFPRDGEL